MNNTGRYYPLIDEIKYHVFNWATENEWKKLPKGLNVALTNVMNEIKIYEALKNSGAVDDREERSEKQDKVAFVNIFKKKYLELTDLNFTDPVSPMNQVNISRVITDVNREGGSYAEFIEWFFDDFCTLETNKKYMPPTINFMCSKFIVDKYLYVMKDTLKMRKKEIVNLDVRNMLLEIAIPFFERTKDKDFYKKITDFSNGILTASKFFELMKKFAIKFDDKATIEKCKQIDDKRNKKG